ncbi:MAG TPA: hypothetical protein VGI81_25525, partial [Tepidisphaeraceae bacterium]
MNDQRTRREMLRWAAAAGAASVVGAGNAEGQSGEGGAAFAKPQAGRRPNILVFMTDQQRGDSVAPYRRAHTPNVDRLAREGVTFA